MEALREFLLAHGGEVIEESNRETFNTLAGEAAKEDALGVLALLQKRSAPAQAQAASKTTERKGPSPPVRRRLHEPDGWLGKMELDEEGGEQRVARRGRPASERSGDSDAEHEARAGKGSSSGPYTLNGLQEETALRFRAMEKQRTAQQQINRSLMISLAAAESGDALVVKVVKRGKEGEHESLACVALAC